MYPKLFTQLNVEHDVLLTKLKFHRIHNMNHKRFRTYLTSRKQFIECDKTKTETNSIICGVPQGSILTKNNLHQYPHISDKDEGKE